MRSIRFFSICLIFLSFVFTMTVVADETPTTLTLDQTNLKEKTRKFIAQWQSGGILSAHEFLHKEFVSNLTETSSMWPSAFENIDLRFKYTKFKFDSHETSEEKISMIYGTEFPAIADWDTFKALSPEKQKEQVEKMPKSVSKNVIVWEKKNDTWKINNLLYR